jgi:hypothetical protein
VAKPLVFELVEATPFGMLERSDGNPTKKATFWVTFQYIK